MSKYLLAAALVVIIQPLISMSISIDGGIAEFDELDSGIMMSLTVKADITPTLFAGMNIGYFSSDFEGQRRIVKVTRPAEPDIDTHSAVEASFIPLQLIIGNRFILSQSIIPSIGAGFGWGFVNEDIIPFDTGDWKYSPEDHTGFRDYNGPVVSGNAGVDFVLNPNISLGANFSYMYGRMRAQEELAREGFVEIIENFTGFAVQGGISYRF